MPSGAASVFCPRGRWTQVEWYIGTIPVSKLYIANPAVRIRWRWFAAGIPPYWEGAFTGRARITLLPSIYMRLEFNPDADTRISFAS